MLTSDYDRSNTLLAEGNAALVIGDWQKAHAAFESSLSCRESAEGLEGLGISAWWLDDAETTFASREHAYKLYVNAGDRQGAATSGGDITMSLVATAAPGTHLIDLYPMIYRDKGIHTLEFWNFELPQLTALRDHPALRLGYRLPVFRLAIEVVP